MKKIFLLIILIPNLLADTNKTYLALRPHGHHANIYYSVWKEAIHTHTNTSGSAFSVTPLIATSDSKKEITRYFTFDDKLRLEVGRNKEIDNRHLKFDETSRVII